MFGFLYMNVLDIGVLLIFWYFIGVINFFVYL